MGAGKGIPGGGNNLSKRRPGGLNGMVHAVQCCWNIRFETGRGQEMRLEGKGSTR